MQIIKPKVEIIRESDTLKRIELAGRTCYKSEDRITDDSAERFFKAIIKRNHTSVLEHSNLIIYCQTDDTIAHLYDICNEYAGETHKPHYIRNDMWAGDAYIGDDIFENESRLMNLFKDETFKARKAHYTAVCEATPSPSKN